MTKHTYSISFLSLKIILRQICMINSKNVAHIDTNNHLQHFYIKELITFGICQKSVFIKVGDFIKSKTLCQEKSTNPVLTTLLLNAYLFLLINEVFNKVGIYVTINKSWVRYNIHMDRYCRSHTFNPILT